TELQEQLGIEMGPARQAEVARYKVEVNAFKLLLEEIGVRIGEVLLPGLIRLGEWFASAGPTALAIIVPAIKGFVTAMEVAAQAAVLVYNALKIVAYTI